MTISRVDQPKPCEEVLMDYLGYQDVYDISDKGPMVKEAINYLPRLLDFSKDWERHDLPSCPEFELRYKMSTLWAVVEKKNQKIIAGTSANLPVVLPAFRGYGILAEVNAITDILAPKRKISSYSIGGLMSRVRTHRLHVTRALDRGVHVPAEVLQDYHCDEDGMLRLKSPLTVKTYESAVQAWFVAQEGARVARVTEHMSLALEHDRTIDFGKYDAFSPDRNGQALATALAEDTGALLRITRGANEFPLIQAEMGEGDEACVVDLFGARPARNAVSEFVARNNMRENAGEPVVIHLEASLDIRDHLDEPKYWLGLITAEDLEAARALPFYAKLCEALLEAKHDDLSPDI